MPVYNAEKTIRDALNSLVTQSFGDFELIISDNASTDNTETICREYAQHDSRIRYIRQTQNKGALRNFEFVLTEAVGDYYMWAAADDEWGSQFIEENVCFLENNTSYIASISTTNFAGSCDPSFAGTHELDGETYNARISQYIQNLSGNSRFYSLFRTSVLKLCPLQDYIAGDWFLIVDALFHGKMHCLSGEVLFFRRDGGSSSDAVRLFDGLRKSSVEYVLPLFYISRYIFQRKTPSFTEFRIMASLNVRFALCYWASWVKGKLRKIHRIES